MKYKLVVKDNLHWINSMYELMNEENILYLSIDFHPKYLRFLFTSGEDENGESYRGISFFKDENTLRAEGEQTGEILIYGENIYELPSFIETGKYSCEILLVKPDYEKAKWI